MIEIVNYKNLKESISLILSKYLDDETVIKILEEWDDTVVNNEYYLKING